MKKVNLWNIFITFFKIGAFTFGGGYAMISILEEDLVNNKKWITSADMLDMLVIAESTPGVIAVNTATSVGYKLRGVLGALIATLGVVLPSFLIICGLSFAIDAVADNTWYKAAFSGVQACVTVLIVNAFVKMGKQLKRDWFSAVLLVAAFAVALFTDFDVIFLILIGGALGVAYVFICDAIGKKKQPLPLVDNEKIDGEQDGVVTDGAESVDEPTDETSEEHAQDGQNHDGGEQ